MTLFALNRDLAKRLFAARTEESQRAFVSDLAKDEAAPQLTLAEADAAALHLALCGSDAADGGEYPLNHVVFGGRPLLQTADLTIVLKRPDNVAHVAQALATLEANPAAVLPSYKQLVDFYRAAAESACAVILVRTD